MSAGDEIRRAAAGLRKAAQLRRDELRGYQTELGRAKDDHDRLVGALKTEQSTLKQRLGENRDSTAQTHMSGRVDEIGHQLVRFQDDHQHQINAIESHIRELEQQINQYEQEAAQLEQQAA